MTSTTCQHKHCGQPILYPKMNALYKWSAERGERVPMHTGCFYAHPDYDVSKGLGSPFTTITLPTSIMA